MEQSAEKRLILRVLTQWHALSEGGTLPRRSQINPQMFGDDWAACLLLDVDPRLERSRFAYIGEYLRDPHFPPFERQTLAECQESTLLHLATCYAARVIGKGVPISTGGVGLHEGMPIIYRSILLPLSEGEGRIDGLLGAANYREVPVTEEIHPLRSHGAKEPVAAGVASR